MVELFFFLWLWKSLQWISKVLGLPKLLGECRTLKCSFIIHHSGCLQSSWDGKSATSRSSVNLLFCLGKKEGCRW